MGQALYRKYRPRTLSEIVGQDHITKTLRNAIAHGTLSHAYLLTGPRGVGKTSVARILAHEVNNLPYGQQANHLDIIEIDAASNRRIDEIRDLRDKVHIMPTSARYKVYIIDEVHMLTREAFNALLKTLEEPPQHAIFILATTEFHKLPETIISRTQHFAFKPIDPPTVVSHLQTITKQEGISIDDVALERIAQHGEGSFRDSISLLDQARNSSTDVITIEDIEQLLGIATTPAIDFIISNLMAGSVPSLLETLDKLQLKGMLATNIAKQLGMSLREQLVSDQTFRSRDITQLMQALLAVADSKYPERLLEIILLEFIFARTPPNNEQTSTSNQLKSDEHSGHPKKTNTTSRANIEEPKQSKKNNDLEPSVLKKHETPKEKLQTDNTAIASDKINFDESFWPVIVSQVKKSNSTLYGILKMAKMTFAENTITLSFRFLFHQKQINEPKNRQIIESIIQQQTGQAIKIVCQMTKQQSKDKTTKNTVSSDIETISNIFGGGEVLKSDT